jgi:hypothetical protein
VERSPSRTKKARKKLQMESFQDSVREQEEVGSGRGITRGGMTPCFRRSARKSRLQEDTRQKNRQKRKDQRPCTSAVHGHPELNLIHF